MDAPPDLYRASRDELIALIGQMREQNAAQAQELARLRTDVANQQAAMAGLQERVGALLAILESPDSEGGAARPTTMPGLKPASRARRSGPQERPPRTRRARGYGRRRMRPTAYQVHAMAHCPHCATALSGGTIRRSREVIEVAPTPVTVTRHDYVERRCPCCGGRWLPGPEMDGVVVGRGRLGVGLLSLIAVLREELRLPIGAIQRALAMMHGLSLSVGGIVGALRTVAQRAEPVVASLEAAIRASPVVHVDETGWREEGRNGYVWTFSTAHERVFVHGGRERTMLESAIGDAYDGVLVSDFYAVYTGYAGRHQYCWAHLLRDVDELARQHRDDVAVPGWAEAIYAVFGRARSDASVSDRAPLLRRHQRQAYEAELGALCAPYVGVPEASQRVLAERMTTHLDALFVFVEEPSVPATNNAAERSLRHLVTSRKISGGTRSPAGTATKMTLASLFGTWRLHGHNPWTQCRALLTQSQV